MNKESVDKNNIKMSVNELQKEKKRFVTHQINLECKKEQLSILIERLSSMSEERSDLLSAEQGHSVLSRICSIGDQLIQAITSKKKIENEITQTKQQINSLNNLLKDQQG